MSPPRRHRRKGASPVRPTRVVHTDCVHYVGDRPCVPHKREGVICRDCPHYRRWGQRILVVKLDAMGDVLRTTCILEPLHVAYPDAQVTWVTRQESVPLLEQNPLIHRIVPFGNDAHLLVTTETFDIALNLDPGPEAGALLTACRADEKRGFRLGERGAIVPSSPGAETWYHLGLWDDLKRKNQHSYQEHAMDVAELDGHPGDYILNLTDDERLQARRFLAAVGVKPSDRIVGLNTGGGGRWRWKRWTEEGFRGLAERLTENGSVRVLLFGGEEEKSLVERLAHHMPDTVIDPGVHPVRAFAALLAECDVLVTGDTLAMHLGLAAKVPSVILFGPTSLAEIEVYGRGKKLAPNMDCLACYLPDCNVTPKCMEQISVDEVHTAVLQLLVPYP